MRLQFVLLLALLLGTVAVAAAQAEQPGPHPGGAPTWLSPEAPPATDTCAAAPNLGLPDGGQTVTNPMSESAGDPILSCMWGTPPSSQGFRTVWYKFTPTYGGLVTIDTAGSTYDTVLAVYSGNCGALTTPVCSDDYNAFTSRVTLPVIAGRTYYVEVADWHSSVSGSALLNLSAQIQSSTNWQIAGPMAEPRSRHVTAVVGGTIYVIGGQTVLGSSPVRTPRTDAYNTATGSWQALANMPAGSDGLGYSNTAAVAINGKIYVPSGYVGNNNTYDGTHWAYDIATNSWLTATANSWAGGAAPIYEAAVAYTGGGQPGYYVVGGMTGPLYPTSGWQARSEMYFYADGLSFWSTRAPMTTPRFGHAAAIQQIGGDDFLCVAGGITTGNQVLGNTECYDIASEQWITTTATLNFPRYFAGSAVAPNGDWYVFGGTDASGQSVAVTERYDRANNAWIVLDSRFDLGTNEPGQSRPPRGWPRGGFVNHTLWAAGGHQNTPGGEFVINLVERLFLPDQGVHMPIVFLQPISGEPDDHFGDARPLPINLLVAERFYQPNDYVDVYFFDLPSARPIGISLSQIGAGNDFNLHLYTDNKLWLGSSENLGSADESLALNLGAGRYYLMVERVYPPPGTLPPSSYYFLLVQG